MRTPSAIEGAGGANSAVMKSAKGRYVMLRDQMADLATQNGLKVPEVIERDYKKYSTDLLPTPTVSDTFTAGLGSTQQTLGSLHSVSLAQIVNREDLLPTPTTQDGKNTGGASQFHRNTLPLNAEVTLLGTPRTSTSNGSTKKQVEANAPKSRIEDQVLTQNWGRFAPAIERWAQVIGRPAPDATKPDGKNGQHRLSENFTEWLMGLPEGWVTGVGLTRNDALKACGNGVVPQQAELALRILLENTKIEGINK